MAELDRNRPFTTGDALSAGISRTQLGSPEFRTIVRGVHVRAEYGDDPLAEGLAALLVAADQQAAISHFTAARVYRAVVPDESRLHVTVPPGTKRRRRDGVVVHWGSAEVVRFRTVRITSPRQTFLDLAAHLDLVDLVVLGDSLVRRDRCASAHLVAAAKAFTGRGARLARRAAYLVRQGVDSPMETRCRMLRVLSGLPELTTDIRFYDEHGNLMRRLDSGDRRTKTAVEYDGRHHVQREQQWEADIGRREEFENDQWRILTLISKDIYTTPGLTIDRQAQLFRQRGIPVGPLRDEWRRHFRGRD